MVGMKGMRITEKRTECCPEGSSVECRYPGLEEGAKLFRALGDGTRLAIIRQLQEQGEVCACDFAACCDLAQPTVSHHLKVLREAGVVTADKRGLWVFYTLNAEKLETLRGWLPSRSATVILMPRSLGCPQPRRRPNRPPALGTTPAP